MARERVLDPFRERIQDGLANRLEAVLEVEGAECRLDERGKDVSVDGEALQLLRRDRIAPPLDECPAEAEPTAYDGAALPGNDVRPNLGELPLGVVGEALVELASDREAEDGVPEELEPLVRVGPRDRPGRVREDMRRPLVGQRVDQVPERRMPPGTSVGLTADDLRCTRRPARRFGFPGRPRPRS
jgi:hypothetical protein